MPESFDPYHVWLGIPPEDQPPNHYRLLGIRPFESNADVIDNMADQRMTHLRTFQTGKNGKLSQKLLNDVAAARLCLLGKQSKQDYDRKLRAALASSPSGVALAAQTGSPPVSPSGIASSASPPPVPSLPVSREALRRAPAAVATVVAAQPVHKSPARPKGINGPLVGVAVAVLAVIGLGVGYAIIKQHEQPPGDDGGPSNSQPLVAPAKPPEQPKEAAKPPATLVLNVHATAAERAGITVWVDDKPVPLAAGETAEFSYPPGQHRVKAVRQGFKPFETIVTAAAGERSSIDFEWHPATVVQFKWPPADRAGAVLTIDGQAKPLDAADLEFTLAPGRHQIRIVRRGFQTQVKTVDMTPAGIPPIVPVWIPAAERPIVAQNPPAPKPGQPIDLLALIDPQGAGVRGQWRKENGVLISDRGRPAIVQIPFAPQGDYRVTMVLERVEGDDSIALGLPFDGHIFTAGVDCFTERGGMAGIEQIDGRRVYDSLFRHDGKVLVNGRPSTLDFTVLKDHFLLAHNGQTLVDWPKADYGRCALLAFYRGVDESKLFITTWSSSFRISRLELTPLGWQPSPATVAQHPQTPPRRNPNAAAPPMPVAPNIAGNDTPPVKPIEQAENKQPKVAVPTPAEQATATKAIQGIYRDDLKRAVTAEQKIELAKKLRTDGVGTADDPAGRFVLLKMARDLAAAGGDLELASDVLDKLADRYEVDRLEMKSELLIAASKSPQHPDDCWAKLNSLADDAVAADRYDLAKRALVAALTLKDPALRKQTLVHQKEINETETEFHRLKSTIDALNANPDDPAANLAVGKFDCLVKGNFEAGLPLLAKGSDKALAELAKLDLAQSADAAEQIKVADGWWDTGKRAARLRAKAIYESALPGLNGISRVRIEKRLQELEAKSGVEGWTNLLRLADPAKNVVQGKWSKSSDGLQCELAGWGQMIAIPFEPAANYDLRVEFTRLTGKNDVMLLLPVAGRQVRVALGVYDRWGGIDRINNQMVTATSPLARPAVLENNKRYVLDVAVRASADGAAAEIFVRVNGTEFTSFQGQASQLTGLPYGWRLPNEKWPGLGANSSTAVFHSMQYRKVVPRTGGR